jgi:membrane protease YdiL (CAAX protease family)
MNTFRPWPILAFICLSFALAWAVALPLWQGAGIESPYLTPIAVVMMFTPALAAFIVGKVTDPRAAMAASLGLSSWRPWRRTLRFSLFAMLASLLMMVVALLVAAALGLYRFDIVHFSGLAEMVKTQFAGREAQLAKLPSPGLLAAAAIAQVVLTGPLAAVAALGEEIGWRGWLLPRLMPLGTLPALALSGVVWALWHAPLVLLGFNYPASPGWLALLCMSAMCIVVGAVFGWIRLRSGSVWPAAIAHGTFNTSAGLIFILGQAGQKIDMTQATPLGWSGWIFPALLGIALFHYPRARHGQTT